MRKAGQRVASLLCAIGVAMVCVLLLDDRWLRHPFGNWFYFTFMAVFYGWFIYLPAFGLFQWLLHRYQPQTNWKISAIGIVAALSPEVLVLLLKSPVWDSIFLDLLVLTVSGATYGFFHYSWIAAEQYNSQGSCLESCQPL